MWNVEPEFHRFEADFKRFPRDFRSLNALRTDLCQAAHAHQVVGGHGQHKYIWSTRLSPRTITCRMLPTVLAQPKPCSISLRLR